MSFPVDVIGGQNINDIDEIASYLEGLRSNPSLAYHKCPVCDDHVTEGLHNMVKHKLYGDLSQPQEPNHFAISLSCPNCQKDICVRAGGQWWKVADMMTSTKFKPGAFHNVNRPIDRLILYVVSQIWYQQYEMEPGGQIFLPPLPNECAKILWVNGHVIGFYTMKQRGSLYDQKNMTTYTLPVLDLIYVKKKFRRSGYATFLLENFISYNLGESIGISAPISDSMNIVLYNFLLKHEDLRDLMWETSYNGGEGYRKNIWLSLKNKDMQQYKSDTRTYSVESDTTVDSSKDSEASDTSLDLDSVD